MQTEIETKTGYVYWIFNKLNVTDCYVGSTTKTKEIRYKKHLEVVNNPKSLKYNRKLYSFMRQVGVANFACKVVMDVEYSNIKELREKEQLIIRFLKPNLNTYNAVEDKELSKVKKSVQQKKYYESNKDKIIAKVNEYAEHHKEQISEAGKKYRAVKKEEIKARRSKVVECPDCGANYTHDHKSRHLRSAKHIKSLN